MMIDFPEDPEAYDLEEQYMFGRSLLVAPVLEEGQTVKEIYLPKASGLISSTTLSPPEAAQRITTAM